MASRAASEFPVRPEPSTRRFGWLSYLWQLSRNSLAVWPEGAYEEDFLVREIRSHRTYYANSPDTVRHVLLDHADNYVKSPLLRQSLRPLIGQGLLISEGALWRRQRHLMAPMFSPRRVLSFVPVMTSATEAMLARWDALPPDRPADIADHMMQLTLEIIARTMFSDDLSGAIAPLGQAATEYQLSRGRSSLIDLFGLPRWVPRPGQRAAAEAVARMDRTINGLIARRRENGAETEDLLTLLLAARDAETGEPMSDTQIRDEVATILLAGHETTANALTWTWYLLSGDTAVAARLHAELAGVLGGRAPTAEDLPNLVYTRMVLEEAMRLYPPAHSFSRQAIAEDRIAGRHIPAGAVVIIAPWLLHRHRKLWDEPDMFNPENFAPEQTEARPRFAYVPFGGGLRSCIGASLTMTEALVILAMVAQRYAPRLVPHHRVMPIGLITLRPKGGMPVFLDRREEVRSKPV
jgi:cytochrome P450